MFRQVGDFRIEVSRIDGLPDYKFVIFVKQHELMTVPITIISRADNSMLFEFMIKSHNLMMEIGYYRIKLFDGILNLLSYDGNNFIPVFTAVSPLISELDTVKFAFSVSPKEATMGKAFKTRTELH